jgi:GDPmannose 4,6-dehydratase
LNTKIALITGITGQDGAILARILLDKGYAVHGIRPYMPVRDTERLEPIQQHIVLHHADMSDGASLLRVLQAVQPDEIYNLAAMSHVHASFSMPELTANVNGLGTLRLLEAMRTLGLEKTARFYQASSSEMFGNAPAPQNEHTPFAPCSPYAAAKLYAYWMVRSYRDAYGFHASNGILFNHESPVRGEEFVTRKITRTVGEIEAGVRDVLTLGNLDAQRDWGHAQDYMMGAWMMLQQDEPDDYVLATGVTHTVRDFVVAAFSHMGTDIVWQGEGVEEEGRDRKTGRVLVQVDPKLHRPMDVQCLIGDASKAHDKLGWSPFISFDALVSEMVEADRLPMRLRRTYG